MKDMNYAPTENDRKEYSALQYKMDEEMEKFSRLLLDKYEQIAILIEEIRIEINNYIYRPIKKSDIDKE